ncbi:MAG: hypothetical protein QG588_1994 [Candidatus Poribacteria bacterium]|nr:hypothetical protein [Candidatus Poribacteria bacterium]
MLNCSTVLVVSPHTDDGELGCGGTITRMIEEGKELYYVAFSICEDSVPEGFPKNILEVEVKKATATLGIKLENLIIKKYRVRTFPDVRQNILEDLVQLREQLKPDLVFMPSLHALHQDHKTTAEEGLRAFKRASCFGYDFPHDMIQFNNTAFIILEKHHIQKKIEALNCYESQRSRKYVDDRFLEGLARVRGCQIHEEFAEAFEVMRLVCK